METATLPPRLLALLESGAPLAVLTGAGVSAESGLATFRGPQGMWEGLDPASLATPQAFQNDPLTVWRFYAWRRRQALAAEPNPAHVALAAWESAATGRFQLVTQNVDGLHERAGSRGAIRLHGTLWRLRCSVDAHEHDDFREELGPLPPRCTCGAPLRPAVVWFGEPLPTAAIESAERAAREAALVLVAGTSSTVYPAAALPRIARAAGAYVVEINPEATALTSEVDLHLRGAAGRLVPELARHAGVTSGSA